MRVEVAIVMASASIGCATSPERGEPTYRDRVERRVELAWEEARFVLRHNPTTCNCPPFEVRLGATWQRVELVASSGEPEDDEVIAELGRLVETSEAEGSLLNVTVMGRLEEALGECGRGALFVSLVPVGLVLEDERTQGP